MNTTIIWDVINQLFKVSPMFEAGNAIWRLMMTLIYGTVSTTPQDFSSDTWSYITDFLYPWSLAIGIVLLNVFFLAGFFKQSSNLRENMTIEILVNCLVKLVMANVLMTSGLLIMQQFLSMASTLSGQLMLVSPPVFSSGATDAGTIIFSWILGLVYLVVAVVTAATIFLVVYGRYIKIYLAIVCGPPALSTMAGGMGFENSAKSWIKTFLSFCFEVVIIAMVLVISGKMIGAIDFLTVEDPNGLESIYNGLMDALQSMMCMILMASSVKGADKFMQRFFGL